MKQDKKKEKKVLFFHKKCFEKVKFRSIPPPHVGQLGWVTSFWVNIIDQTNTVCTHLTHYNSFSKKKKNILTHTAHIHYRQLHLFSFLFLCYHLASLFLLYALTVARLSHLGTPALYTNKCSPPSHSPLCYSHS